jgi:hypothetical protein
MAIYHDVRELMQEDNRPTFVGVVRFKMEINVTREWYRLGNAMPSAARNWISKSGRRLLGRMHSPTYAGTQPYCVLLSVRAPDCLYIRRSFSM